jgi:hypothetical protein
MTTEQNNNIVYTDIIKSLTRLMNKEYYNANSIERKENYKKLLEKQNEDVEIVNTYLAKHLGVTFTGILMINSSNSELILFENNKLIDRLPNEYKNTSFPTIPIDIKIYNEINRLVIDSAFIGLRSQQKIISEETLDGYYSLSSPDVYNAIYSEPYFNREEWNENRELGFVHCSSRYINVFLYIWSFLHICASNSSIEKPYDAKLNWDENRLKIDDLYIDFDSILIDHKIILKFWNTLLQNENLKSKYKNIDDIGIYDQLKDSINQENERIFDLESNFIKNYKEIIKDNRLLISDDNLITREDCVLHFLNIVFSEYEYKSQKLYFILKRIAHICKFPIMPFWLLSFLKESESLDNYEHLVLPLWQMSRKYPIKIFNTDTISKSIESTDITCFGLVTIKQRILEKEDFLKYIFEIKHMLKILYEPLYEMVYLNEIYTPEIKYEQEKEVYNLIAHEYKYYFQFLDKKAPEKYFNIVKNMLFFQFIAVLTPDKNWINRINLWENNFSETDLYELYLKAIKIGQEIGALQIQLDFLGIRDSRRKVKLLIENFLKDFKFSEEPELIEKLKAIKPTLVIKVYFFGALVCAISNIMKHTLSKEIEVKLTQVNGKDCICFLNISASSNQAAQSYKYRKDWGTENSIGFFVKRYANGFDRFLFSPNPNSNSFQTIIPLPNPF